MEVGILGVERLGAGDGADVTDAALVQRDRAAIEGERAHREVHDRAQDAVEVERRGDLAAHLHDEREVARAIVRRHALGVSKRDAGDVGQSSERDALAR